MSLFGKYTAGLKHLTQTTSSVHGVGGVLPVVSDSSHRLRHGTVQYTTKTTSYYDVLEVTPKASQRQVKAAYYRLSKLYHPDVNPGKDAKRLFGQVSEAYEVLGNVHQRKLYDRGILNSPGGQQSTADSPFRYEEFVKKHGHSAKGKPPTGKTKIYDFDEFYRQHYGESRQKDQFSRETYERETTEENEFRKRQKFLRAGYLLTLFGTVIVLLSRRKMF